MNLSNAQIFIMLVPTVFAYYLAFQYLQSRQGQSSTQLPQEGDVTETEALTFGSFCNVCRHSWRVLLNCVSVYLIEYIIFPGLVDRDTLCPLNDSFLATHAYTYMLTAAAIGVTISRSSVAFFRIKSLEVITVLQALNFVLWWREA